MSEEVAVQRLKPSRTADSVVALLSAGGDHPLMYSFPHGALFTFDPDLRYLSAGGLGLADVGLSREMLEGRTIFEAYDSETAAALEPYFRAALSGVSTTVDVPFRGRVYLLRLAPVCEPSGEIVAGLGFTQDVTDARLAEQSLRESGRALRESEERTRLTFDNAPIGQAIVELDGRWRSVNAAVTAITGYSEDELLSMTFQDITHPDDLDLDLDYVEQLLAGDIKSYQMEKRYITASQQVVWALLSGSLVRDKEGQPLYFIAQIQDITERKRQLLALQDLTAMLAHDLRTSTTVISGYAHQLQASWADLNDDEREHVVAKISGASLTLQTLLENSLTASTLDSNALEATPCTVEIATLVRDVLTTLHADLPNVDTSGLQPGAVWVDPAHLTQVLSNLLTNAAKYGGDHIAIATASEGGSLRLTVSDNGDGVDAEFVPHLFDRFSRSPSARQGGQRGTGLGLYIARDLLALNHAQIEYRSMPDTGASFVLTLPTRPADPE